MPVRIRIEHVGSGWRELFLSDGVQGLVDEAGRRIASRANAGFRQPHYDYAAIPGPHYARGFVTSDSTMGAYYEATDKRLTRAVGP